MQKNKDIVFYKLLDEILSLKEVARNSFNEIDDDNKYLVILDDINTKQEKLNEQLSGYYRDEDDKNKTEFRREMELDCMKFRKILFDEGFNLIGFSIMMLEDTFIFETQDEAMKAYAKFEKSLKNKSPLIGWWYEKEEYKIARQQYEQKVHLISCMWLDEKTNSFKFDRD